MLLNTQVCPQILKCKKTRICKILGKEAKITLFVVKDVFVNIIIFQVFQCLREPCSV